MEKIRITIEITDQEIVKGARIALASGMTAREFWDGVSMPDSTETDIVAIEIISGSFDTCQNNGRN